MSVQFEIDTQQEQPATTEEDFPLKEFQKTFIDEIDLKNAVDELDKCKKDINMIAKFYSGDEKDIKHSSLYLIVHAKSKPQANIEPKRLLAHYVMEKVVYMKWESFAKRMYLQQLVLHCLLVMTMTLSVSMSREASSNTDFLFPDQLTIWLYVGSTLGIVFVALFWYKPSHSFAWKVRTLLVLIAWYIIVYFVYDKIESLTDYLWFAQINNIIVGVISFYFLAMEIEEWSPNQWYISDNDIWIFNFIFFTIYYVFMVPFGVVVNLLNLAASLDKQEEDYYSSAFNLIQIPTYFSVILYVISEFTTIFKGDAQIYFGILLSFILWVLSLEYVEAHPTAGYLLPMMRAMAGDMMRFMIFYAPFQCAYTCAYYLLFHESGEPTYNNIGEAFITTFLVVLGQIDLEPFKKLNGASYVVGYTILLTHATLVIVMLLNVIVAMMSKTMEDSFEKAKMKAIISFAECVLRCEKTAGLRKINVDAAKEIIKDLHSNVKREDSETITIENESSQDDPFDTGYQSDADDFELKEVSTDDRIQDIQKNLNNTVNRMDSLEEKLATTEATMKQVLQILLELRRNK
ncbi:hypothetical protein THRCLA_21003 [Thraustotheca clavata]|uniref:Ion transport domain-containing protein n=1 Tax=Thraustotheca clavata TaxID=74557 RepID=A0A1W0A1D9_9STRA|nr:hypothetical protein THRCLA_21003 [Thraustotheca clavata]